MTGVTTMHACPARFVRFARGAALGLALGCASLLTAGEASAEEMGRLFFTPQQRQDLDRQRNAYVPPQAEARVESLVTVNGQVSRSSGKTTTWINGVPQYDTYRGRTADRVAIESGDAAVGVKVGQTLDRVRGEVQDPLRGGEVKVHPSGKR
jgi:hypothetical protein